MKVRIETSARLHLGLLDLNGDLGRLYGSIGVAIDRPALILGAERVPAGADGGEQLAVDGPETERVAAYARRFLARHPLPGAIRLQLQAAIPAHVGLGSGTQLALAVGAALAHLGGLSLDAATLSQVMGRGAHSGIGIATFERGGLVVDGGHAEVDAIHRAPLVLFHQPFPAAWRFVVAIPAATTGLNGASEQHAFQTMAPAPAAYVEKICRLLVMQLLPALIEQELAPFGQALTGIQQWVGDSFAAIQGGRFATTLSGALVAHWLSQGAAGAGQSSWGPTVYALAGSDEEADRLAQIARAFLARDAGGEVFVARAANHGARIVM